MTQRSLQTRQDGREPVRVFLAYASRDANLVEQFKFHLKNLERYGLLRVWDEREISAGAEWRKQIDDHINASELILVFLSADFLASDYAFDKEMEQALERQKRGQARVIPIILRPVLWQETPFSVLQALPRAGKPVTDFSDLDQAFYEIAKEIQLICQDLLERKTRSGSTTPGIPRSPGSRETIPASVEAEAPGNQPGQQPASGEWILLGPQRSTTEIIKPYQLHEVFVRSNIPGVTFVEHPDFRRLGLYLQEPSRGVVLEGPSGIGKTTALRKALEVLKLQAIDDPFVSPESDILKEQRLDNVFLFNARNPRHQQKLETLRHWHRGMVVIDDFHFLPANLHTDIVNYLKELADGVLRTKKLVLVGIPYTGQTLVNTAFDVAMRIDVLKFGLVKDELVLRMIEAGEQALNIIFDRKSEIVLASIGSLNIAQYLCYNICANAGIDERLKIPQIVTCDVATEVEAVVNELDRKFGATIRRLAAMGGPRDLTGIKLLEELKENEDGILSLSMLKIKKNELAHGIEMFIHNKWMETLYREYPDSKKFLFYNPLASTLIIDDPQLMFYLKKLSFTTLRKEVNKLAEQKAGKVFVSYSHRDAEWLRKLQVYLAPVVREGIIDLWDDEKIILGSRWRDEIEQAIQSSAVAIMLVSPYFMASEFISDFELPQILAKANQGQGATTVISLILDYCSFTGSGLDEFQTANPPDKPLIDMTLGEQGKTLVRLAEAVRQKLLTG